MTKPILDPQQIIRQMKIFNSVSDEEIRSLVQIAIQRQVEEGSSFFHQGDAAKPGETGEIVIFDDATLKEKDRIKNLITPTGKFNVFNTVEDIY
jgi:hypothetical protein